MSQVIPSKGVDPKIQQVNAEVNEGVAKTVAGEAIAAGSETRAETRDLINRTVDSQSAGEVKQRETEREQVQKEEDALADKRADRDKSLAHRYERVRESARSHVDHGHRQAEAKKFDKQFSGTPKEFDEKGDKVAPRARPQRTRRAQPRARVLHRPLSQGFRRPLRSAQSTPRGISAVGVARSSTPSATARATVQQTQSTQRPGSLGHSGTFVGVEHKSPVEKGEPKRGLRVFLASDSKDAENIEANMTERARYLSYQVGLLQSRFADSQAAASGFVQLAKAWEVKAQETRRRSDDEKQSKDGQGEVKEGRSRRRPRSLQEQIALSSRLNTIV